jgi:hypothetical protein
MALRWRYRTPPFDDQAIGFGLAMLLEIGRLTASLRVSDFAIGPVCADEAWMILVAIKNSK